MGKRYPFTAGYLLSFYSRAFYQQVAYRWKGGAIGYYTLLAFVVGLVQWSCFSSLLVGEYDRTWKAAFATFPDMKFEDGKLSSEGGAFEFYIGEGQPFMVIDPDRSLSANERDRFNFVVTDTEFVQRDMTGRVVQREDLSEVLQPGTMNASQMQEMVGSLLVFGFFVGTFFWLPFFWGLGLFFALFFSLVTMLMAAILRLPLPYAALYRLTIVAMTPGSILVTLMFCWRPDHIEELGFWLGAFFVIWAGVAALFIAIACLFVAGHTNREAEEEQALPPAA